MKDHNSREIKPHILGSSQQGEVQLVGWLLAKMRLYLLPLGEVGRGLLLFFVLLLLPTIMHGQIITTVAGGGSGGLGDGGLAIAAQLSIPGSVAFDSYNNMYIGDCNHHRLRKISPFGIITTIAGTGTAGYSGDGGQATNALLDNVSGVAVDKFGNIYFTEVFKNVVRKISPSGIISTYAGNGLPGYSGDGGLATAARINRPSGIWVDTSRNLFFTDGGCEGIRKVSASGIISTVAGNGSPGYSGDGGLATNAMLNAPHGVVVDHFGNIFIADQTNNRIRKVSATDTITTIAGDGTYAYSGDNGPATLAKLQSPWGIVVDDTGNVIFSEYNSNTIRKISTSGIITTIAGNNIMGYGGDGGPATAASFNHPYGIALDSCENLYIADGQNNRMRKVTFDTSCHFIGSTTLNTNEIVQHFNISIYPNPAYEQITITANSNITSITITDLLGQKVLTRHVNSPTAEVNITWLLPGIYFVTVTDENNNKVVRKMVKQ
jgi:hypothetical protein